MKFTCESLRKSLTGIVSVGFLTVVVGCDGIATRGSGRRVNVLLITLDTTRADRIGCYGNKRIDTPNLDRLAREGTQFDQAFTPIPSTLPSHCSILTGTYPAFHGVHDNGVYALDEAATSVAEILKLHGYATAAFISAFVLDRQYNLDQGFGVYNDQVNLPLVKADPNKSLDSIPEERRGWVVQMATQYQRRADVVTQDAIQWLEQPTNRSAPFFLWVHYFDPHQPYQAPGKWATRYDPDYAGPMDGTKDTFYRVAKSQEGKIPHTDWKHMVARYDAEISYMDEWIGRLVRSIDDIGRAGETLVIVVGDHGESFGEHNIQIWEHNQTVFDEVMRVPFIVRRPDGVGAGNKVTRLVRTIDVAPTILDWLGLPIAESMQGASLMPLTSQPNLPIFGEILIEARYGKQINPATQSYVGLRTLRHKLILTLGPEQELMKVPMAQAMNGGQLFDLQQDAAEKNPLAVSRAHEARGLEKRLVDTYTEAYRDVDTSREIIDPDIEALRALDYVK